MNPAGAGSATREAAAVRGIGGDCRTGLTGSARGKLHGRDTRARRERQRRGAMGVWYDLAATAGWQEGRALLPDP